MSQQIALHLNDPALFDRMQELPAGSGLVLATKNQATEGGHAAACLAFDVMLPNGETLRVQATTTVALLVTALHALFGEYGYQGIP